MLPLPPFSADIGNSTMAFLGGSIIGLYRALESVRGPKKQNGDLMRMIVSSGCSDKNRG